jgi:hypothetical protein
MLSFARPLGYDPRLMPLPLRSDDCFVLPCSQQISLYEQTPPPVRIVLNLQSPRTLELRP